MNINAINELIIERNEMKTRLNEINKSLKELRQNYKQFHNNIASNSELMTKAEKTEKIFTFHKAYSAEKSTLETEKRELEMKISFNAQEITSKSRIPAQEYNLKIRKVLHKNGYDYTTRFMPVVPDDAKLDGLLDTEQFPVALMLVTNTDKLTTNGKVTSQNIIIATLPASKEDFGDRQTKLLRMQVPVIEPDRKLQQILTDANVRTPNFKINVDGGASACYNNKFGNWLANEVRKEFGIYPTNQKIQITTM